MKFNKSPLKWAGGKGKLLPVLLPILKKHKQDVYIEPFMGSCTVALNVEAKQMYLADLNVDLVNFFSVISSPMQKDYLQILALSYFTAGREMYNTIREQFNNEPEWSVKRAAMFLYLNKFGFNGLCRYNKSGKFNTPVGSSTSVPTIPYDALSNAFIRLKDAGFVHMDFRRTFEIHEISDYRALIYCDSPYVPLTTEFNYTADGFSIQDHKDLKELAKNSKHTVILSNHLTPFTDELYNDADEIHIIDVKRTISCNGGERKKVQEIIAVYKGENI